MESVAPLILDILIVAVIVLFAYYGFRNGLIKSVISAIGKILAFVLSFILSNFIASFIYEKFVMQSIIDGTNQFIHNAGENVKLNNVIQSTLNRLPTMVSDLLFTFNNKEDLVSEIADKADKSVYNVGEIVATEYAAPMFTTVITAIVWFFVFLLLLAVVKIVANIVSGAFNKIILITPIDKIGGVVVGALQGAIVSFLVVLLVKMFIFFTGNFIEIITPEMIESTNLFKFLYYFDITGL